MLQYYAASAPEYSEGLKIHHDIFHFHVKMTISDNLKKMIYFLKALPKELHLLEETGQFISLLVGKPDSRQKMGQHVRSQGLSSLLFPLCLALRWTHFLRSNAKQDLLQTKWVIVHHPAGPTPISVLTIVLRAGQLSVC